MGKPVALKCTPLLVDNKRIHPRLKALPSALLTSSGTRIGIDTGVGRLVNSVPAMRGIVFLGSQLNPNAHVGVNKKAVVGEERLTLKVSDGDEVGVLVER